MALFKIPVFPPFLRSSPISSRPCRRFALSTSSTAMLATASPNSTFTLHGCRGAACNNNNSNSALASSDAVTTTQSSQNCCSTLSRRTSNNYNNSRSCSPSCGNQQPLPQLQQQQPQQQHSVHLVNQQQQSSHPPLHNPNPSFNVSFFPNRKNHFSSTTKSQTTHLIFHSRNSTFPNFRSSSNNFHNHNRIFHSSIHTSSARLGAASSTSTDPYTLLGLSRDASTQEIKKRYRELAKQYHPDLNPGPEASAKMAAISTAYQILSDPKQKQFYDQTGMSAEDAGINPHEQTHGSPFGAGFGGVDSSFIFTDFTNFFTDAFGGGRASSHMAHKGEDVATEVTVEFLEAAKGCRKEIHLHANNQCGDCSGTGCAPGTSMTTCRACNGTGTQKIERGPIIFGTVCSRCNGSGQIVAHPCRNCKGSGIRAQPRAVSLDFPAGIRSGMELRISGQGHAGTRGGRNGDLFVKVNVRPHPEFTLVQDDVHVTVPLTLKQCLLGGEVNAPTLDGHLKLMVAPGTTPGEIKVLKGKGIKKIHERGWGDIAVHWALEMPKILTPRQRELIEEFDNIQFGRPTTTSVDPTIKGSSHKMEPTSKDYFSTLHHPGTATRTATKDEKLKSQKEDEKLKMNSNSRTSSIQDGRPLESHSNNSRDTSNVEDRNTQRNSNKQGGDPHRDSQRKSSTPSSSSPQQKKEKATSSSSSSLNNSESKSSLNLNDNSSGISRDKKAASSNNSDQSSSPSLKGGDFAKENTEEESFREDKKNSTLEVEQPSDGGGPQSLNESAAILNRMRVDKKDNQQKKEEDDQSEGDKDSTSRKEESRPSFASKSWFSKKFGSLRS